MTDSFADATAQAELVRSGQASALELVDDAIARVEKLNGELNAVIHPRFDRARDEARGALPDGPFRGVPLVLKDLFAGIEGDPLHEGMKFLRDAGYRSDHTDELAQRYLDAGFVCVGRTNTPELGIVPTTEPEAYGPSRNPWDTSRTTGGSSGGSAAAVASGMVAVGHANDGGGSIRIPASCCGLVGLKPSRGRTSLMPDYTPIDDLLVAELCVTRSVRDTAAVLDVLHGAAVGDTVRAPAPARPYRDEVGAPPGKMRIGLLTHNPLETGEIHPDCVSAARDTARLLESLGHTVEETFPAALGNPSLVGYFTTLWAATLVYNIRYWERKIGREITPADVEALTWSLFELGRAISAPDYIDAQHATLGLGRAVEEWYASGYDLLLTPTLGEPPVELGTFATPDEPMLGFIRAATFVPYTPLANMTGEPAISLPLHWNGADLPIGVQLMAAYGREDLLLRVAAQLESARPWIDRVPPVHA
ncbi:MAG TPA: amidase family protein [Acidimicrobiia bacterium]|nr:amidase family protein [Acidimicrobiia bacterium]